MIPLLALLPLLAGPDRLADEGWLPLNRVDLIVNEECITAQDIQGQVLRLGRDVSTPEERTRLLNEVTTREISNHLKVGAGRDKGFDQDMVQRIVRSEHEARLERAKSAAGMADQLARMRLDSGTYFADTEAQVLAMLWTRSVTGQFPGAGGRHYVDRYVRPGRLKLEFERRKSDLALPSLVKLQQLQVGPRLTGTLESARELAEDCLEQIRAGADFGQVAVDARCAPADTQGVEGPYELDLLKQIPGVGEFLASARPGDVSEVLPVRDNGALRGFRVVKLLELQEKRAPSFVDEEFQRVLAERIRESLDKGREDQALGRLLRAAYVWPPEAFGRAREER